MTLSYGLLADALIVLHAGIALATAMHALLHVRDPRAAWGWIAVCWLAPLLGAALYLLLGTDRLESLARSALAEGGAPPLPGALPQLPQVIQQELRELIRIGDATSRRPLLAGNRIEVLHNGEQAYPAMLGAIARARRRVHLSSYIFAGDDSGRAFAEALAQAQARGVEVRVLIDAVGDLYHWPRGSALLRGRGLSVRRFQLARRFVPLPHLNLRNHRKLLIVDEHCAFTGGINISDRHRVDGSPHCVIDLHFRVEGDVVAQLAQVFAEDWLAAGGPALAPPIAQASANVGPSSCRAITEGPNEDLDRIELILLGALANAHRRVHVMTPYFIPMPVLSRALEAAALRGVEVLIILPERSNLPWVDWACRHWLRGLLSRGVRVLLRPAPFAHSKLLVVDDYYSHIGSANLDPRSLRLNFELVVETYCEHFAAVLQAHVDEVRAGCRELSLRELDQASRLVRLRNALCWLFSAYL